jgi:hypothetical protein
MIKKVCLTFIRLYNYEKIMELRKDKLIAFSNIRREHLKGESFQNIVTSKLIPGPKCGPQGLRLLLG